MKSHQFILGCIGFITGMLGLPYSEGVLGIPRTYVWSQHYPLNSLYLGAIHQHLSNLKFDYNRLCAINDNAT